MRTLEVKQRFKHGSLRIKGTEQRRLRLHPPSPFSGHPNTERLPQTNHIQNQHSPLSPPNPSGHKSSQSSHSKSSPSPPPSRIPPSQSLPYAQTHSKHSSQTSHKLPTARHKSSKEAVIISRGERIVGGIKCRLLLCGKWGVELQESAGRISGGEDKGITRICALRIGSCGGYERRWQGWGWGKGVQHNDTCKGECCECYSHDVRVIEIIKVCTFAETSVYTYPRAPPPLHSKTKETKQNK
jgi:hypothetical protein